MAIRWYWPGPPSIDPDQNPGGIVVHTYRIPTGVLLLKSKVATLADAERAVLDGAPYLDVIARALDIAVVVYDGDTGDRFVALPGGA